MAPRPTASSRPPGGLGEFTALSYDDNPVSASAATVPVLWDGVPPDNFAPPPTLDGNVHSDDALCHPAPGGAAGYSSSCHIT